MWVKLWFPSLLRYFLKAYPHSIQVSSHHQLRHLEGVCLCALCPEDNRPLGFSSSTTLTFLPILIVIDRTYSTSIVQLRMRPLGNSIYLGRIDIVSVGNLTVERCSSSWSCSAVTSHSGSGSGRTQNPKFDIMLSTTISLTRKNKLLSLPA